MTWPVLGHKYPPEITVTEECHAEQVKNLPFHAVGRAPDSLNGSDLGVLARQFDLQHAAVAVPIGKQMVDDLDAILVIDPGFIAQAIEPKFGFVAQKFADLNYRAGVDHSEHVGLPANLENLFREALLETLVDLDRLHLKPAPFRSGAARGQATARS